MEDLGLALWRSGYRALDEAWAERAPVGDGADAFESRLLGRRALVVRGREGARLFYDTSVVERGGTLPAPLANLLFGRGAVHLLDGAEHAARKAMFLEILAPERMEPLALAIGADLRRRVARWPGRDVTVFDELVEVYGAAVLAWAGVVSERGGTVSHRLAAIVDGFSMQDPAGARAWLARLWANRWARALVEGVRSGSVPAVPGSALQLIATGPGRDLDARVAGVELVNLLRPTVAVAWPGTFAAYALDEHPQWRTLLGSDRVDSRAEERRTAFAHEVRRTAPFAPALAGRVRSPAEFADTRLEPGDLLVLDIRATNRDPRTWTDPEEFLPERFAEREPDPFELVAQGGGHPATGHRCPGEPLAVRMLAETVAVLADVPYEVVSRREYAATRVPTLPADGLRIRVPAATVQHRTEPLPKGVHV